MNCNNIKDKSVLIIGSGYMAEHYSKALSKMGIKDVTVIGNTKNKVVKICKRYNFIPLWGGFKKNLSNIKSKDLVIIAMPIPLLVSTARFLSQLDCKKILLEKPGDLYAKSLEKLEKETADKKIRIGYNRLHYPSFYKLSELIKKDGGVTSCQFTFTERIHKINFNAQPKTVLARWGISNSLHVISMAMKLIGMPKKITCIQENYLPWHKTGSVFVGSGISNRNIPFSYHADWNSAGGWGIDIMTRKNAFRLRPLEQLYKCKKGTTSWEKIDLKKSFPDVKEGIAEEIFLMLDDNSKFDLVTLKEGNSYIKLAEKIFNYR
ncbi:MAG: hypothetical protein GWO15_02525 [Nitrosopumilaceae archaeon]|nr:hypothetical protein [Nitrosopumilaceae archaeon]